MKEKEKVEICDETMTIGKYFNNVLVICNNLL